MLRKCCNENGGKSIAKFLKQLGQSECLKSFGDASRYRSPYDFILLNCFIPFD